MELGGVGVIYLNIYNGPINSSCAYPFPRVLVGHFSKAHGGANKQRLPFVWKTR